MESAARMVKIGATGEDKTLSEGMENVVRFDATLQLSSFRNLITANTRSLSAFWQNATLLSRDLSGSTARRRQLIASFKARPKSGKLETRLIVTIVDPGVILDNDDDGGAIIDEENVLNGGLLIAIVNFSAAATPILAFLAAKALDPPPTVVLSFALPGFANEAEALLD